MIEDIEFSNPNEGSNTTSCLSSHTATQKEFEVEEILNDPFVKKVQEIFEVKEIKIYPKV